MNIDREDCLSTAKELIGFLEKSPTCFHAVQSIADCLEEAGFTQLHEGEKWELTAVSYTHLDVYKRQPERQCPALRLCVWREPGWIPTGLYRMCCALASASL